MLMLISNIESSAAMSDAPLEFNNQDIYVVDAIKRVIEKYRGGKTKIDLGALLIIVLMSLVSAILNWAYLCIYFYYASFYPFAITRSAFHLTRGTPCQAG